MKSLSLPLSTEEYSILENPRRDIWDAFLNSNSLGNLWQTIDYGEFIRKLYPHTRTLRLVAMRDGMTYGIVQGMFSSFFGLGTVMNIREGPLLCLISRDGSGLLKSIIVALEKLGVKNRVMRIRILWPYKWGYLDLFRNMGYKNLGTKTAYTIDLNGGEDGLWRRIDGNKRKNIKRALDRGVEFVERDSFESIEEFYNLFLDLAERHKFVPQPLSWFQMIWKSRSQKDSKLFFARWKGSNLSSVFATIHVKTIYALGWGYLGTALEVRPNDLLHWKIMEWGCKRGFSKYHMGYVQPDAKDPHGAGIWRWKREWNGDLDKVYIFTKSTSKLRLVERVYDKLKHESAV
jgi:hypothetical protein